MDARTTGSEKHPYKAIPGEYFVPEIWSRKKDAEGNEVFQTYGEWVAKMAKEQAE